MVSSTYDEMKNIVIVNTILLVNKVNIQLVRNTSNISFGILTLYLSTSLLYTGDAPELSGLPTEYRTVSLYETLTLVCPVRRAGSISWTKKGACADISTGVIF